MRLRAPSADELEALRLEVRVDGVGARDAERAHDLEARPVNERHV